MSQCSARSENNGNKGSGSLQTVSEVAIFLEYPWLTTRPVQNISFLWKISRMLFHLPLSSQSSRSMNVAASLTLINHNHYLGDGMSKGLQYNDATKPAMNQIEIVKRNAQQADEWIVPASQDDKRYHVDHR